MADASKESVPAAKDSSPTPVFGSASTFGTGAGFAGFTGASQESKEPTTGTAEEEEAAEEEDCSAEFKPIVELQEVETVSGEESENILVDFKCKLYRFDNDSGEWKERGIGQVRLLESKENKKIRLLHRQEKTLKIRANHIVMPGTKLQEHTGSEKAWVWSTVDFADEVQKPELFCIRFGSVERAQEFKQRFDEAVAVNAKLLEADEAAEAAEGNGEAPSKEDASEVKAPATPSGADELASKVEKVSVKEDTEK